MPQLTPRRRSRAVGMLESGWAARAVAREFQVSHTSISNLKRKWEMELSVDRRSGSGKPRLTSVAEDQALLQYVRDNPFTDSRSAIAATGFSGSARTARRRLAEEGLHRHIAAVKEILTPRHCQARVEFAERYLREDNQFWRNVIFSDEKTFQSTKSGHVKVYRPKNRRFDPKYVCQRARSGRFSVHAWAWISCSGPGVIWQIDGNLTGPQYRSILSDVMLPSVNVLHPPNFIYQHDNSSIHTSAVVRQWIEENNLQILPWPARSPDLNPIENICAYIKMQLESIYDAHPANQVALWDRIQHIWDEITDDQCRHLVESMPDRLRIVVDNNGQWTGY